MSMPPIIHEHLLPYVGKLQARDVSSIDLVVIHCTELPDIAMAREYGERVVHPSGTGNSGHYYIDRDGTLFRYVPDDRVAHHVRGRNDFSIGIELINTGRWPDWFDSHHQVMAEPYPDAQIDALLGLLAHLRTALPNLKSISGHEDLDTDTVPASDDPAMRVQRKLDPGPMFPWQRVLTLAGLPRLGCQRQPL